MSNMSSQLKALRFVLICALLALIVGSLIPRDYVPPHQVEDKLLHFAGYAVVALMAVFAIRDRRRRAIGLGIIVILGVALEFAQIAVPGRAFEFNDMVANCAGVLASIVVGSVIRLSPSAFRKPLADGSSSI